MASETYTALSPGVTPGASAAYSLGPQQLCGEQGLVVAELERCWRSARRLGCCGQEGMVPGGVQQSRPGN